MERIKNAIRDVPDFPKPGILFKDITPVLQDPALFSLVIDALTERYRGRGIDKVAAMESRGFIFAAPLCREIEAGFVPLRKRGKLPWKTRGETFDLEYGTETLEIHQDAIIPGEKVLLLDDLLATGGTAEASVKLVQDSGGELIEALFVVELLFLAGRKRLGGIPVHSLVTF